MKPVDLEINFQAKPELKMNNVAYCHPVWTSHK